MDSDPMSPATDGVSSWEPANALEMLEGFFAGTRKMFQPLALSFLGNSLPERDFTALCRYISRNGPIGKLVLSSCGLDDARLELLSRSLERNSTLTELDISFNLITDQGAHVLLLAAVSMACNLSEIISVGNKISEELERQLWEVALIRIRKRREANPTEPIVVRLSTAAEARTSRDVYNATQALLRREAEVRRRFQSAQDELRDAELSLAIIRKNMSRLHAHESPRAKDNKPPLGAYETPAKYAHNVQAHTIRINLRDIEMGEVIDTGGSGAVISYCYVDGWQCVCKEMSPEGTPAIAIEYFEKEITLLENLPHHRNIVRYLFHDLHQGKIRLFMTRYRSSLLFILYDRFKQQAFISAAKIRFYALEILKGLEFLHRHAIIHRDLKSDNIFVALDEHHEIAKLAIGDFDCAKLLSRNTAARTVLGTAGFMAPEVILNGSVFSPTVYTYKADIFSFGMVLYELLSLQIPYSNLNEAQITEFVRLGVPPDIPPHISQDPAYQPLIQLHLACINVDPVARPDASTIKQILIDMRC